MVTPLTMQDDAATARNPEGIVPALCAMRSRHDGFVSCVASFMVATGNLPFIAACSSSNDRFEYRRTCRRDA